MINLIKGFFKTLFFLVKTFSIIVIAAIALILFWFGPRIFAKAGYAEKWDGIYFTSFSHPAWTMNKTKLEGADKATFEILKQDYARDKNQAYFKGKAIEGADPQSMEQIKARYYRDKNSVYLNGKKLSSDPDYFVILKNYSKDRSQVWYNYKIVENAHAPSFEAIGDVVSMARDENQVFYRDKAVEGSHGPSFEKLGTFIWKDKNTVYDTKQAYAEADAATFQQLNVYFFEDKNHIYYRTKALKYINKENFRIFGGNKSPYATDEKQVFFMDTIVPGADIGSFKLTPRNGNHSYAEDQFRQYYFGKVKTANPEKKEKEKEKK